MIEINVLTFGADPSGNNDSTAAFRAALNEMLLIGDSSNSALVVPAGTYKLSGFIYGSEPSLTQSKPTEPEGGASRDGCGSEPVGWCGT